MVRTESERVQRIKLMLQDEQEVRTRRKNEVTVDYIDVRAEHREECLKDVLKLWGPV